jgi:4-amino-4-deoxy-L-arabinose transferase-like glycosyltransferase
MAPEAPRHSGARPREALWIVLLAAALMLPPVGHRLVPTSHEARFALLARDMLERHVAFDVRIREQPYRNKPPLHPWTILAGSWWTGRVTEWSARLPSALATITTVLGTFLLADRLFGGRAGRWAALVVATSYGTFAHSQMILPDMLMVAFGVLAGYGFWRAVTEPGGRLAMIAFYAMLALGFFAKGPAALLPLAVAIVWLWTQGGPRALRRLASPGGIAVFIALSLVWLIPFLTLPSDRFVRHTLQSDWLFYYLSAPRPRAIASQLGELLVGFLPWTLLAPLAAAHALRTRSEPAVRFAGLWFVVQLVLIMASTNQRVRYLLVLYPGAALLVGWWAADDRRPRRPHRGLAVAAVVALPLVLVTVGWLDPTLRELATFGPWLLPLAAVLVTVLALAYGLASARPRVLVGGVAAGMALTLATSVWPYNAWLNATQDWRAVAAAIERHARGGEVGAFISKGEDLQIDFYLGRFLTTLWTPANVEAYVTRPDRPVVVVNQENWERWSRQLPELEVLETVVAAREALRVVRLGRPAT